MREGIHMGALFYLIEIVSFLLNKVFAFFVKEREKTKNESSPNTSFT